jgi:tartrate dehydratase alpha subunit/fumarate hydratase class I-like protein
MPGCPQVCCSNERLLDARSFAALLPGNTFEEDDSTALCYYGFMSEKQMHRTEQNRGGGEATTLLSLDPSLIAALVEKHVGILAHTLRADYLRALETALATEENPRGRTVLEQLLANAHLAATEKLPLCQDTGSVWVCLEVAGAVAVLATIFSGVDAAVARAAQASGMRMSMLHDALINRTNTGDNTPAFCEIRVREATQPATQGDGSFVSCARQTGETSPCSTGAIPVCRAYDTKEPSPCVATATLHIMLKGGGSDNASALVMLPPGAGVEGVLEFVTNTVAAKGANACPPLVIGVGVGGSFDTVAGLAKHALLREVGSANPHAELAVLEGELLARINALGIGPGGLGGSTTALAVHIESAPCHIAALPVAVNLGCTALRSVSIPLLG